MWNVWHYIHFIVNLSMLAFAASSTIHGNPADDLVDRINLNRTAQKLKELHNNPGLGCMALQYIDACQGNCSSTNTLSCRSPEEDITEIFAPNCGVELPTVDIISGRIIGCQSNYLTPDQVFSSILSRDNKTLSVVRDKKNTELGTAFKKVHHGLFIWSVLFSSGQTNSTFVLEGGTGIKQKGGCFSGTGAQCSGANKVWFLNRKSVFKYALLTCLAHITVFPLVM
ncbi:hypothetical protein H6P81_010656 [Aristolochia fimbriata]|uniref:Uncharacterized protein n=1 Tax=Aristolochia fimbriata TaxID=158543 RepID=A0AAV7EST0_ARIFI|nr:hypothetical protein H6P81_010656 [Aristolochia fimbriata]